MALSRITNPFLSSSGSNNTSITSPAANTIAFTTATTEDMRITSAGNVGIGTSSPSARVDNTGTFRSTGATDPSSGTGLELSYRSTYGDVLAYNRTSSAFVQLQVRGEPIIFGNTGGERMRIDSNGNVGINTTAPVTYYASGGKALHLSGGGSYNSTPSALILAGSSLVPGRSSYILETFAVNVSGSTEITRFTGTSTNGFRMMFRIALCGHSASTGNGHIYAMYYWDGSTGSVQQIFRYDSTTNLPGLTFNTSTSNVLIISVASANSAVGAFLGVMTVEWFIPQDFSSGTYTVS